MSAYSVVKTVLCLVVFVAAIGCGTLARADDAGPEAFYGRYKGTGFTQTPSVAYFGFDERDLDVQIGPEQQGGFFVDWTTVVRSLGEKEVKRNSARVVFEPSGRPGLYVERGAAARVTDGMSWASIFRTTLTVRLLTILDDGSYELQTYERSLKKDGMFLFFKSDRDGAVIRVVTASLEKQAE
jgi:hypothetical protein